MPESGSVIEAEPAANRAAETPSDSDVVVIDELRATHDRMKAEMAKIIIGQDEVVERLLICILSRGHALLMGVPGLAKTLMVNSLSKVMSLDFNRIQFTPDLMPSDITGTDILQETVEGRREFEFVEKIERKSSLEKEGARSKEATDPPKPAKKEKKPRPAPVMVPSQPHLNGGGVHAALKSPTKGPPPLPRGPPPANQPKRWDGRPGTRPPLPAGPPPTNNMFAALTPMSPTANGGGGSRSSLDHHPHGLDWNEEKEKRRQDELVNSMLESLTSTAVTAPPGYGGRSHSQSTTPTGAAASFGGSMWSPSGAGGSDGGFSLFSGGSNPTSPTAGELNRRRNRFSH